jgi:hypothetical protein
MSKRIERVKYEYLDREHQPFSRPSQALQDFLLTPDRGDDVVELIIGRFVDALRSLQQTENFSSLCFLQIEGRPSGALSIAHRLTEELNLPAFLWAPRCEHLQGHSPLKGERFAFVHDSCLSGTTLLAACASLQSHHSLIASGAVVFINKASKLLINKDVTLRVIEIVTPADKKLVTTFGEEASHGWVGKSTHGAVGPFESSLAQGEREFSLAPGEGMESTKEGFMPHNSPSSRVLFFRSLPLLAATLLALVTLGGNFPVRITGILLAFQVAFSVFGIYWWCRIIKR